MAKAPETRLPRLSAGPEHHAPGLGQAAPTPVCDRAGLRLARSRPRVFDFLVWAAVSLFALIKLAGLVNVHCKLHSTEQHHRHQLRRDGWLLFVMTAVNLPLIHQVIFAPHATVQEHEVHKQASPFFFNYKYRSTNHSGTIPALSKYKHHHHGSIANISNDS